jgi:hypothetical protein
MLEMTVKWMGQTSTTSTPFMAGILTQMSWEIAGIVMVLE